MGRILVTGGSGFIGWHLVRALAERGERVRCLVRSTSNVDRIRPLGVGLVQGDLRDRAALAEAVADCQVVYHLAGCTKAFHPKTLFDLNETAVRRLAEACAEQPSPPVLVAVSSLAAAGPAIDGRLRTEADPAEPVSTYGKSKRAGEVVLEQRAGDLPITIVRPPIVVGEGDLAGLEIFRPIARFGLHVVPGWGQECFSLIHAADLAEGLILAAETGRRLPLPGAEGVPPGEGYYFLASDDHPTYADLGRMIGPALGRRVRVVPTPPRTIWLVAAMSELGGRLRGQAPPLNFDKARDARAGSWICSPRKAREELGFSVGVSLEERLRQTAAWYRKQGWL